MSDNNDKLEFDNTININESNGKDAEVNKDIKKPEEAEKPHARKKTTRSKEKEIEKLREEVEIWRDKYLRQVAEFENFRKRKERELDEFWKVANADLIKKLLPILDDIERSLESAKKDRNFDALVEGIELVYKSFLKVLEAEGVTQISAKGQEFDPEIHEAMMQVEKEDAEPNTVVEEHQKGYLLGKKILRPAKVIVSK
ncbi:MAG: nucleotide exchange factor GrpE [Calditrichaeota bacterium]|nr:MAG: nucleotide exchange factor GrpE [Calditrichota bacterium]